MKAVGSFPNYQGRHKTKLVKYLSLIKPNDVLISSELIKGYKQLLSKTWSEAVLGCMIPAWELVLSGFVTNC